jgi:hypothetical protein
MNIVKTFPRWMFDACTLSTVKASSRRITDNIPVTSKANIRNKQLQRRTTFCPLLVVIVHSAKGRYTHGKEDEYNADCPTQTIVTIIMSR